MSPTNKLWAVSLHRRGREVHRCHHLQCNLQSIEAKLALSCFLPFLSGSLLEAGYREQRGPSWLKLGHFTCGPKLPPQFMPLLDNTVFKISYPYENDASVFLCLFLSAPYYASELTQIIPATKYISHSILRATIRNHKISIRKVSSRS